MLVGDCWFRGKGPSCSLGEQIGWRWATKFPPVGLEGRDGLQGPLMLIWRAEGWWWVVLGDAVARPLV